MPPPSTWYGNGRPCRQNRFVNLLSVNAKSPKRLYRYRVFTVAPSVSAPYQIGMGVWDITEDKHLQDQLIQSEKLTSLGTMVSGIWPMRLTILLRPSSAWLN